jgi:cyclopropane-fatty-acyl-phospholipid synthase
MATVITRERAHTSEGLLPVPQPTVRGRPDGPAARTARRVLLRAAAHGNGGTLVVHEGGTVRRAGQGDPEVTVTVHDARAYAALMTQGSRGLATAYVAGWWDAEDVTGVLRLLWRRIAPGLGVLDRIATGLAPLDRLRRRGAPDRDDDAQNIHAHYDLSNDLFALMLDETMTYSCGTFDGSSTTLAEAQEAKIDRICTKLQLQPDDHLVEIGTGWGGLAVHAAGRYGCRVTTTTISAEQRAYAERRVAEAGLADRVQVVGEDWRDLRGTYDKLVSVEMIEAVDWRHHRAFLRKAADLLGPGGLAAIQAIVIEDRSFDRAKRHQDLVRSLIFPGSCIPSVANLTSILAEATDLRIVDLEDIGPHYAETLRRWRANLDANAGAVAALGMPAGFERLWRLYLCYCEAAFEEGHISDVQLVLAKPGRRAGLRRRPL